ncbi:MAG: hypothetical protein CL477_06660 [Acidobacteria bacterium]|jgi:hypothetical protein|nr:hypothetical protein [Acidobacteriota bacterium]MDP7692368.1 hypothetical protein [Vicinamibacterales bacterium]HJN46775.1 hypothetical protein [Vicinamibacterales bacterium]|tara:strand:- start:1636 stop:2064 length:429 start_codon:yes stop_codon:yes gene_type:complete
MVHLLGRAVPVLQWALAVGFLAAAVVVGASVVRELRLATGDNAGLAQAADSGQLPASVPAGAISLPVLLFDDGKGIRVGDSATHIAALLGRTAEVGRHEVDAAADGERLTRFYDYRGRLFVLVFTLAESHTDPTVTAIYLEE